MIERFAYRGTARARSSPAALAAGAVVLGLAAWAPGVAAQASLEAWPVAVDAQYRLRYNGIEVGKLNVKSTRAEKTYAVSGAGKVSVFFGAVTWAGSSTVTGTIAGGLPQPVAYAFDWKNNRKGGVIKLGFKDRVATDVSVTPPPEPHKDLVPLLPAHKAGAWDPVSALLMLSRADGKPPCERRVPIFDGKQRYEIELTFKRKTTIPGTAGSGAGEVADVCRAMYVPVAGHRDNAATKTYMSNKDVEVVMRRVPGSIAVIPYSVTIPTFWGTGSMVTERIEVTMAGGQKVAFGR
jgi:hypothetical protein